MAHVRKGGECVEENEILATFPDIGLGLEKPDFLFCMHGSPAVVIEAKNEAGKVEQALTEATQYADTINRSGKYSVKVAVGAAGEENHGFYVAVAYFKHGKWVPLTAQSYQLTTIPSKSEVSLALIADNATTTVSVPSSSEFIDAAIELSRILRLAKVEAPLRPKVIGSIVLAMYQGEIEFGETALQSINDLVAEAITEAVDLDSLKKTRLIDALRLTGSDYDRLNPMIGQISALLRRLNLRSVLQTDTDFLGLFYEAFLRYGYDNNALGIVFTPRHITSFCADLIGATMSDRVIDVACGTGGFLVAAFDRMLKSARGPKAIEKVKQSLFGTDTNPTIWALATLNMFFRGDGKTHIENATAFDPKVKKAGEGKFTRAFLNPPFSQEGEPERDFIDIAMDMLEPGGLLAAVVKAGIFADDDNSDWRSNFTKKHKLLGAISLPEDLFYPTAAPTTIVLAEAHTTTLNSDKVFVGRVWNDGFEKLKGKRVERPGSQLIELANHFHAFRRKEKIHSSICKIIGASDILGGKEWSPQQHLDNIKRSSGELKKIQQDALMEVYKAVVAIPELVDCAISDFGKPWASSSPLEFGTKGMVSDYFTVANGKSQGEKHYNEGEVPYVSSGDATNSIIRLVTADDDEVFLNGGITVTAFGQACLQPWPLLARGNGGSAVRVLLPKFAMSVKELLWFVAQINAQRWRFFYGRMAIKSRLERLVIDAPQQSMKDTGKVLRDRLGEFRSNMRALAEN